MELGAGMRAQGFVGRPSLHDDLLRGRETEVDYSIGAYLDEAEKYDIGVPTVRASYRIIKSLEFWLGLSGGVDVHPLLLLRLRPQSALDHPTNTERTVMPEAYLVDAVRTPVTKRGGALSAVHPADLGAHVLAALFERNDVDPASVDDVFFGCVDALGPQAGDIARTCWLAAGLPEEVPGVTIDRQCGSSQQAVHFAAQAVLSGTTDVIVAGGVQNMSMIPISSAMTIAEPLGFTDPFSGSRGWVERYGTQEVSQFRVGRHGRGEVGHLPRRHGSGSRSRATTRGPRAGRAPVRPRDRSVR